MKRVCQQDLARKLGLSQGTISGVLNNNPAIRVSEATRKRILAALEESRYSPNRLANALFSRETKTVGIICQVGFLQLGVSKLSAVVQRVIQHGFLPLVYDLLLDMKGDEQCQLLTDMNVRGVILINASYGFMSNVYPSCLKGRVKVVSIDSPWEPGIQQFFSDREQGFYILAKHLIGGGYRKIALLTLGEAPSDLEQRYAPAYALKHGAGKALAEAGLEVYGGEAYEPEDWQAGWGDPYQIGGRLMARLLDKGCVPEAVICSNDAWAIGAMKECRRQGIRIPEDIAIVGFNGEVQGNYAISSLTTIAPPVEQLAELAVAEIIKPSRKKSPKTAPETEIPPVVLPCKLVVRESCGVRKVPADILPSV